MTEKSTLSPIRPCPHVETMAAYALADLRVPEGVTPVMLAQNESLRPPSPSVVEHVQKAITSAQYYPDPDWTILRAAIAEVHKIPATNILCGAGSMELITALGQVYAGPGHRILSTQYGYAYFRTVAQITRSGIDIAPERELTVSVDELLQSVRSDTRLVFVANPGNPSGTRISSQDVVRLRGGLPDNVLLVVDEAYGEFADDMNEQVFDLTEKGDTVILRTLSKAYGLAGMRVGWGLFPDPIADQVRKILIPNSVSISAQAAAEAAILDQDYMRDTVATTIDIRDRFIAQVRVLGLDVRDSFTNFVLVRFADHHAALQADQALRSHGILARRMGAYGLSDCLRFTVGGEESMDKACAVLKKWREENH